MGVPEVRRRDPLRRRGPQPPGLPGRVHILPLPAYFDYVNDSRHHAQVGFTGWIGDFLTASSFFDPFRCAQFARDTVDNANISQFCDPGLDAAYAAALAARGTERTRAGPPSIAACRRHRPRSPCSIAARCC